KIKLVISDSAGKTVRTLDVGKDATAGINRVWWDLRMDPTEEIKLRTSPLYAPDFRLDANGMRKFPTGGALSVLVPPGMYTVKLIAGGVERAEPLTVRKDPSTSGTDHDIAEQTTALLAIRENVNTVAKMINAA